MKVKYFDHRKQKRKVNQHEKLSKFPKSGQMLIFIVMKISKIFWGNGTNSPVYAVNATKEKKRRK